MRAKLAVDIPRNRTDFRVTLPNSRIVFNQVLALDLVWIEGNPVLHVVDTQTHFGFAESSTENPPPTSGIRSCRAGLLFILDSRPKCG